MGAEEAFTSRKQRCLSEVEGSQLTVFRTEKGFGRREREP
jgi:hypothetical protein